jgi:putative FmdB family regulatory protein
MLKMPSYEFKCPECFNLIEIVTSSCVGTEDAGPEPCGQCGAPKMLRCYSISAIHFKGSGWASKEKDKKSK